MTISKQYDSLVQIKSEKVCVVGLEHRQKTLQGTCRMCQNPHTPSLKLGFGKENTKKVWIPPE